MGLHVYPQDLIEERELGDGSRLTVRPIRPEDAGIEQDFVRALSPESRRLRFMMAVKELSPEMLRRFTHVDYGRDMALIATCHEDGRERQIGVARYSANADGRSCEFAIVVADELRERGVGSILMDGLMRAARAQGLERMEGRVLAENTRMLQLMRDLGFTARRAPDEAEVMLIERAL